MSFNPNSGLTKPSNTTEFTGYINNPQQTDGRQQNAEWASPITPNPYAFGWGVIEAAPAAVRVQLAQTGGVTQTGSPQQYGVRLSNGRTLQLTPNMADSLNHAVQAVAPNVFAYKYTSRNIHVCTVDANGLITAVNRGEAEITIQSSRQVNASFAGGAPSGTEGAQCNVNVTVIA